eukprot:bmy_09053T0
MAILTAINLLIYVVDLVELAHRFFLSGSEALHRASRFPLVNGEGWLWRVGIASAVVKGIASLDWVAHTEVPPQSEVPQMPLFPHTVDFPLLQSPAQQPKRSDPVWGACVSFRER